MSITSKLLIPSTTFIALFFTACGGSDASQEATEAAVQEASVLEVTVPDEPAAAMELIAKELASGNGGILWKAMPSSYQSDVNTIARLAGAKVDAEIYDKSFVLLARLADVADKQKQFILNTELGGEQPAEEVAKIEAAWPSIIGFVHSITSSSISSSEGLQSFDGQSFCETTVSDLIHLADAMSAISGEALTISAFSGLSVKALESSETSAKLEMTGPDGSVETEDFIKVENRWVPTELANEWSSEMADAKTQLEAINPDEIAQTKPQIMGVITMLEGVLTQVEAAETQEQFDQALQGAMMPIMGLMMMQGGMGGGAPSPAMPTLGTE